MAIAGLLTPEKSGTSDFANRLLFNPLHKAGFSPRANFF